MDKTDLIILSLTSLSILFGVLLARFIFWKRLKIGKIAETKTTIGITDYKTMNSLFGVSGVWAQYVGNKCWNVCKTRNMGAEMAKDSRRCLQALDNTLKSDKRLRKDFTYKGSVAIQYRDLVRYAALHKGKIKFVIILTGESNDDLLEFEEMKYAIKHNAISWAPAPGKQTKVYWDWKNNGGNIDKYKKKMLD